jgi:hypothetical protein
MDNGGGFVPLLYLISAPPKPFMRSTAKRLAKS